MATTTAQLPPSSPPIRGAPPGACQWSWAFPPPQENTPWKPYQPGLRRSQRIHRADPRWNHPRIDRRGNQSRRALSAGQSNHDGGATDGAAEARGGKETRILEIETALDFTPCPPLLIYPRFRRALYP